MGPPCPTLMTRLLVATSSVELADRWISWLLLNYWRKELLLQSNTISHWLGANLELALESLLWRHNEHDSVSNHQPRGGSLLNRLFRRLSKKTSKLRVTGLCVGNSPGPVNSPHKGPVTRKMFPFDDVIMWYDILPVWNMTLWTHWGLNKQDNLYMVLQFLPWC